MATRSVHTDQLWQKFSRREGLENQRYLVTHFRSTLEGAQRTLARMFAGATRALTAPMHYFGEGREEPLPRVGDYTMLVDPTGRPRAIWRTVCVNVAPLTAVENNFIWQSGLDGGDRAEWLRLRHNEFARQGTAYGFTLERDVQTLFENLVLVWPSGIARHIRRAAPYLDRGAALLDRLEQQGGAVRALEGVLAQVQTAVIVVNHALQVCYANSAAEALLRRGDAMSVKQGHLRTRWPADQRPLAAAVCSACGTADESPRGDPVSSLKGTAIVPIGRNEHQTPYQATVLPLRQDCGGPQCSGNAIVFLNDPDEAASAVTAQEDAYCRLFRLTPAEARLAVYLTSGASLVEAAHTFGVTHNTVRKQLSAVFDKTDTRRQADLVRVMENCRSLKVSLI
jgi:uncharacterized protein YhfF/DNA-binding CsgD family transcriptional regulator